MSFFKVANPFVRAILRSPLHRMLSGSLLLVTYTGRKSGRTYTIPVMYAEAGNDLLVYVGRSSEKVWWRNLKDVASVRVRSEGGKTRPLARVSIVDSGPGIPLSMLTRIWTPFATSKPQGTGLGLPICQRIVHAHGGRIEVKNRAGAGAEVVLHLPLDVG